MSDTAPLSGAASDLDFALAKRAVDRGWLTEDQVESALRSCDASRGARLLEHLALSPEQIKELEAPPARPVPPEVAEAMKDPTHKVGRFWLVNHLGSGGMGMVFRGWEPDLRQWVALKFLKQIGDDTARAYFRREAQLVAALDHENIAKIYEIGEHNGAPFIAMQFVDGDSLAKAQKEMPLEAKIDALEKVARAVRFAHDRKVIHRDLKPANIMITKAGHVFVMDFGLAKETAVEGESLGGSSMVVGTPAYMAPEQAMGKAYEQSDVYSLAAVLYEFLTGRPPFQGDTPAEILTQVMTQEPVWPRVSPDLDAICLHGLEKDTKRRYRSASEMIEDLEAHRRRDPLKHARRPTLGYILGKKIRKQPVLFGLAAAVLLAIGAGAVLGVHLWALATAMVIAIMGGATFGVYWLVRARREAVERVEVERRERARADAERKKAEEERKRAEEERRRASERLAHGLLMRARQSDEPAVYYAEAYAAFPCELTRANAAAVNGLGRLTDVLEHDAPVTAVAVQGDRIVTGCRDGTVRIWPGGGKTMRHLGAVNAVAISGDRIASAGADRTARVLDGPVLRHDDAVLCVAFGPDGRIATGSRDNMARVWDANGKLLRTIKHANWVSCVAWSPDGQLVTGCVDRTTRVGEAAPVRHDGEIRAVSADRIVVASDRTARIGPTILRHDDAVVSAALGEFVVTGSLDRTARLWRGDEVVQVMRHDGEVSAVAIGDRIVTGSADRTARVWTIGARIEPRTLAHDAGVTAVAVGGRVVTASRDGTARIWDGAVLRHDDGVVAVAVGRDRIATGSQDGTARLWDFSGASLAVVRHDDTVSSVALRADRLATASGDTTARLWTPAGESVALMQHVSWVNVIAFAPDGRIATGTKGRTAHLWDTAGAPLGRAMSHDAAVVAIVFSPDGKRLLTGSQDGSARLWDASTGEPFGTPMRHEADVWAAAFSPDGQWVVTGGVDKCARLWDSLSGEPVGKPMRHDDVVRAVAFSPDSRRVATASRDRTARLWDAMTGEPVGKPLRHGGEVVAAAWSPDGRSLVTASGDGTAKMWDVAFLADMTPPEEVLRRVRAATGVRLDRFGELEVIRL